MSTEINMGWLKDKTGNKFAPKTISSQVITENGQTIDDVLDSLAIEGVSSTALTEEEIQEICTPLPTENGLIPIASKDEIGCVKIGDGVEIAEDGTITVNTTGGSNGSGLDFEFDTASEEYKGQVSIGNKGADSSEGAIYISDYNSDLDYYMTTEIGNVDGGIKISAGENGDELRLTNEGISRISGQPVYVSGHNVLDVFENKVLWSGAVQMTHTQTAFLSEVISKQPTGIVLVFSAYADDVGQNYQFSSHFIPKYLVSAMNGGGHDIKLNTADYAAIGGKYLYISDDRIVGAANNTLTGSRNGVTFNNAHWCLRYVIGV